MSGRGRKIAEVIRREIPDILVREVKDPRICFVTITQVIVHDDLEKAVIYVSVLGNEQEKQHALEGLTSATGYVRRELAARLKVKNIPELFFKYDDSSEISDKLDSLFDKIKKEKPYERT